MNEVEEANDTARLRRLRLDRAVLKIRLERAFLLEQLARRMEVDDIIEEKIEDPEAEEVSRLGTGVECVEPRN